MVPARRFARACTALVGLAWLASACGEAGGTAVDEPGFAAVMSERFGASPDQATCITGYVFAEYDHDEIETLAADGMGALPQVRWEPYLNASVACLTHDQPLDGEG